jgi:hypothetical protein
MSDPAIPGAGTGRAGFVTVPPPSKDDPDPPPPPAKGDPAPPPPPPPPPSFLKAALDAVDEAYSRNIKHFSEIGMGARLVTIGLGLLLLDIAGRVVPSVFPLGIKPVDDLAFVSLLIVSGLMIAGGILANLYLVWSVQRGGADIARMAQASIEHETAIASLRKQGEGGKT